MGQTIFFHRQVCGSFIFSFFSPLFLNVHDKIIWIQNFNHTAFMVKSHRARMHN